MHTFRRDLSPALLLTAVISSLFAQPAAASLETRMGFGTNVGVGPDADRFGAHWEQGLLDRTSWAGNRWTMSLETGVSQWSTTEAGRQRAWQLSSVPFIRIWRGRAYGEFGIGASFFSERSVGTQGLGSSFQFCDHLGAGYELGSSQRVGIRLSHFSNARIASPNDGLDLVQVIYTRLL